MSTKRNPYEAYSKTSLESEVAQASPHKLILMLFDGLLSAIKQAKTHMEAKRIAEKGMALSKAVAILEEGLRSSLDKEVGGELAENLDALYEYCSDRLIEANLKNKPELLDEVVKLLIPIRDAWETIGQPGYLQGEAAQPAASPAAEVAPPENRNSPLSYGHV